MSELSRLVQHTFNFSDRHIGPTKQEVDQMLKTLDVDSLDKLSATTLPKLIQTDTKAKLSNNFTSSSQALKMIEQIANKNKVYKSYIGMGYYGSITPPVILRNILENPGWYTQYTPYQAEIAQGRLESLFNFQTLITDLTGLPIANASLLDEGSAAAEAMFLSHTSLNKKGDKAFFISERCFTQTIDVVKTRASALGIKIIVGDVAKINFDKTSLFGLLLQYPVEDGEVCDYKSVINRASQSGVIVTMAADLLALTLLKSPGELGADIAIGSTQRFGTPIGFGGPHAAYFATKQEHMRKVPGRIIGLSKDASGKPAFRLTLQTREQHIRREKATSNICTAQALLANMSAMYAVYHGPQGLKDIATRINTFTKLLAKNLESSGLKVDHKNYFDTLKIDVSKQGSDFYINKALSKMINLRRIDNKSIGISVDETTSIEDIVELLSIFDVNASTSSLEASYKDFNSLPAALQRTSKYLTHEIFNSYHTETELMRYIKRLEQRDLSLTTSMIPLGSCTMKLNAAAEMFPITWPKFNALHPFCPEDQREGYNILIKQMEDDLSSLTGFDAYTLQPTSGATGELTGLLIIRKYLESIGQSNRNVCLIPSSAHGTNPASAALAGLKIVIVNCDDKGNIDLSDLKKKSSENSENLACLMITYPSTHGVFEEDIVEICDVIHKNGGQVYMDGANFNAQIGLCYAGKFGADVCHLNLHKTFAMPHGGGGPGIGPVGVKSHLRAFLPSSSIIDMHIPNSFGAVASAPWGSISLIPIAWMYINAMGFEGLRRATQMAILNANYIAKRLDTEYQILYKGKSGFVAHECIVDLRGFKKTAGIEVDDVAKRLMDYGFHAPTVSFPVAGTLMIEPTESESKQELDRFCDAMLAIREEIRSIENGSVDKENNVLKNSPHTSTDVASDNWDRPYSRNTAVFPSEWTKSNKFWPYTGRIDNTYGDRNFICHY